MAFTQVKRQKSYAQVAEQLIGAIRSGEFKPGERIPSVRELELTFGVSRPTIREALSALELAGLLETRMGQGSYVIASPQAAGGFEGKTSTSTFEFATDESPAEVLEFRLMVEPEAARLAAERADAQDLAVLDKALNAVRITVGQGRRATGEDIKFHLAVAQASGSAVISQVMVGVAQYLDSALWRLMRQRAWEQHDFSRTFLEQHERTLAAIRAHDGEAAAEAMREHLRNSARVMFSEGTETADD